MRRRLIPATVGILFCFALCSRVLAGNHKPDDFPLRVHIYNFRGNSRFTGGTLDYDAGQGFGNLYENGQPHAIVFRFNCPEPLRQSVGWETYMARWKKPRQTLEMLLPKIGKPHSTDICELKVDVREDMAFVPRGASQIAEAPAATFKKWMVDYQYDPEQGKETPIVPPRVNKAAPPAAPANPK